MGIFHRAKVLLKKKKNLQKGSSPERRWPDVSTLPLITHVDKYAHKHNFSEKIISNKQTSLVSKNPEFYETFRNRDWIIAQIVPL